MRLNPNSRINRSLLYFIGACTIVFALMAFSGVCWCVVRLWVDSASGFAIEYWELFWIASVMLVGTLTVRSIRRNRREEREDDAVVDMAPQVGEQKNWRELYNELSIEERRAMKQILDRYCSESCTPTTCGDSCPADDPHAAGGEPSAPPVSRSVD